ncbi:MAG: hypothetical protein ACFB51_15105 [Anaerolineae bacterium]
MDLNSDIRAAESNPQQLEQLYREARRTGKAESFKAAIESVYETASDNLLFAAWYYRLAEEVKAAGRTINWAAAIPISIMTGLIFWALSDFENALIIGELPQLVLWWSPVASLGGLAFMVITAKKGYGIAAALGLGLLATAGYVLLLLPAFRNGWASDQYLLIALIHLPLLCWVALGIAALGINASLENRFALLIKSIEVGIVGGLYLGAGLVLGGITIGMFAALGIQLPDILLRLITAGGGGLLPVLAGATIYAPTVEPAEQDFEHGLSKLIATILRLLLPLTLIVLAAYVLVIPFNFMAPFESRDVLIVYNLMLFGIIGLLIGATPLKAGELSPAVQRYLRLGILIVAILAALISLYALAAVAFRTFQGNLTPNRLTVIGWNSINIGILLALIITQIGKGEAGWIDRIQEVFSRATNAYIAWGIFLVVGLPIIF